MRNIRLCYVLIAFMLAGCKSTLTVIPSSNPHTPPSVTVPHDVPIKRVAQQKEVQPQAAVDVWERIKLQMRFPPSQHPSVLSRVDWYLKHPNYMDEISKRAHPFLHYIVTEVERRGLPIELALMPLIESDFDTSAYSHKHASGLWQLTPLIAKHYGVKISPWYDGRQDVIDATRAALDFLTYLHKRFDGDWYHAIAAYNTGEGRVARAIKANKQRGKPSDFFSLKLPKQTRHYVPKLLAAASLLKQERLVFPQIANQPAIAVIPLEQEVILTNELKLPSLESLNPGYTRFPALLDGPEHIVVGIQDTAQWHRYIASQPQMPTEQWQQYTIRRGDSLSVIAQHYALTVAQLKQFNQLDSTQIRAGETLLLPILAAQKVDYAVRSGDSLWRIARNFNVTVSKLMQWNSLSTATLRVGDKLTVFLAP